MKKSLYMLVLMISAVIIGGLIAYEAATQDICAWLAFSKGFSLEPKEYINFSVLNITFGFNFEISVAQVICILIGILIYAKTAPKVVTG